MKLLTINIHVALKTHTGSVIYNDNLITTEGESSIIKCISRVAGLLKEWERVDINQFDLTINVIHENNIGNHPDYR